ncbi:sodium-dependent glucose transporter 1A-like [Haliotis rubra]|uniref:sodium-dependent glucose transporter 1A-like n=1 Tax=Haliotis rubra TaxID=36100 RepID=UPI001EE53FE7|nr:sodium-dependent glucose transporter 1A-like [Haliotis rubra]XP_046573091.1 sodium-dependent glucose transporter 1A-like [Haliotis rubra]XP_046573092.1 sodium-dependent glucose transporter 1A-like [Haliotis rubra]
MADQAAHEGKICIRFRQRLKEPDYRRKFVHSIVLFISHMVLGLRIAQHQIAFLDMAQITGINLEQASVYYTAMSVGSFVGTITMGFLFDRLTNHRPLLLASANIAAAVTTAAVPWSTNYFLTIFIFFLNTTFCTAFDTGGNSDLMSTWGVEGKTYMQFLHFSFAIGTVISPLTVEPFLLEKGAINTTCHHTIMTENISKLNDIQPDSMYLRYSTLNASNDTVSSSGCPQPKTRVQFAYLIAGILSLMSGILIYLESCLNRRTMTSDSKAKDDHRNPRVLPRWLTGLVLALLALMNFFHCACGMVIIGYLMVFCVSERGWSKDRTAQLASGFWAGVAAARLLGVFIIRFLAPAKLLFICNATVTLTLAALWLSVVVDSDSGFTVCIIVVAVGLGIIFPTGICFVENDIMKVTGVVTSIIMIAGHCQGMLNPLLLGYLMQEVSMMWYVYLSFIDEVICFLAVIALVIVVKVLVSRYGVDREPRLEAEELREKDSDKTDESVTDDG